MIRKVIYMQNLIICFGLGIMVAAIIVGIIVFMICRKKEKRVQYYIHSFKDCFREKQDIRLTMLTLLEKYKKNSKEAEALKAGLYYLDKSILQDSINGRWKPYTSIIVKIGDNSTLAYVEDAYRMYRDYMVYLFDDDRVDKIHSQSIHFVWKNRQGIIALPKKGESDMRGGE